MGIASYDIPAFCRADPIAVVPQEADTKIGMLKHHLLTQFSLLSTLTVGLMRGNCEKSCLL